MSKRTKNSRMDRALQRGVDEALASLRAVCGSYAAAADQLGVSRQALHEWRLKGKVSHTRVSDVARITGIPHRRIRPDLYAGMVVEDDGDDGDDPSSSIAA